MRWLAACTRDAVAAALAEVAPGLTGEVVLSDRPPATDPEWSASTATVGHDHVVKFAWAQPAAERLAYEIEVLSALTAAGVPSLPTVVAASTDPLLLVLARVRGRSLFQVYDEVAPQVVGADFAAFFAALHEVELGAVRPLREPASTDRLRAGLPGLPAAWLDRVDGALAEPGRQVVLHGDFHGDNQVWRGGRLRAVLDFETVGRGDAEFDLRGIAPLGWSPEPLLATVRGYRERTGVALSMDRVLAWHVRTVLDDVLWRTEAGVPLPDARTAKEWIADLATRLAQLGGKSWCRR